MMDLDHVTGGTVEGWAEVVQSLLTILSTRLNTRVFARGFGSEVPALVDAPMNEQGVLAVYVACAEAIEKWEPRFAMTDVQLETAASGVMALTLTGNYRPRAHLGDFGTVSNDAKSVRILADRASEWRLAA